MNKVIILSGISGSGKSTYAKKLAGDSFGQEECTGVVVCSADHFFMQTGEYKFDASMLSLAHGECFKDFIEEVQRGTSLVLVDNTNTSVAEIAPYVLGGQAWEYEVEIHTMREAEGETSPVEYASRCWHRNQHGVASHTVGNQLKAILDRKLPPWWVEKLVRE